MAHHQLDTQGLLCPMPVIKTQNKIKELAIGDTLEVVASDPGVMHDIPAWCRINGHTIVESSKEDRLCTILIEVCDS
ncbi:hypothetical protein A9Q81_02320 [Gammaproteobacteria bacterium 42_54_T18]|nr:hypothetical protein A9Q81_02320 [Gammaproteobacteria bacterium 42_54_T18]